jgi:hypothetical protein
VVVTLAALAGAGLMGAPQMLIPAAVLGAVAGIVSYVVAVSPTTPPRTELRPVTRARAWRIGAVVGLLALAISGMAVFLGHATGPLLLFAALAVTDCSWPTLRPRPGLVPGWRGWPRPRPPGPEACRHRIAAARGDIAAARGDAVHLRDSGALRDVAA